MRDEDAWRQLGEEEERAARRALDHLHQDYLSFGQRVLRRKFSDCNADDVENAVQQAFVNLWQSRRKVQIPDLPSWRGLLGTTVCNCYIDILRARKPVLSLEELDRTPADERPYVREIVEGLALAAMIGRLTHAADAFWLGLSPTRSVEEHRRRLFAAKLFYLEGAEIEDLLFFLNRSRPGMRPLTPTLVMEWLEDPETLRHLAYTALYYSPAALTAYLLGLEVETTPEDLDALLTGQASAGTPSVQNEDWTPQEVHVILWRYYRNVSPHNEQAIPQSILTLEEINVIIDRCRALFPFRKQMDDLLIATQGKLKAHCGPSHPGLWRRLAFQYRYLDDLTHLDIEERLMPAADLVAFPISQTVLQGWLSSKRLLKALAKTCVDLFEEYNNE